MAPASASAHPYFPSSYPHIPPRIKSCAAAKCCQIADERLGGKGPSARVIVKDFAGKRTGFAPVKPLQTQKYPGGDLKPSRKGGLLRTADDSYQRRCVEMFLSALLRVIIDFFCCFSLCVGVAASPPISPAPFTALSCFKFPMIRQLFSGQQLRAVSIIDKKPNIGSEPKLNPGSNGFCWASLGLLVGDPLI